jgi:hypothetical protein
MKSKIKLVLRCLAYVIMALAFWPILIIAVFLWSFDEDEPDVGFWEHLKRYF